MNKSIGTALIALVAIFSVFCGNSIAAEELDRELVFVYLLIEDTTGLEKYLSQFKGDPRVEDILKIAELNNVGEEKEISSETFVQGAGKIVGEANSLIEEMSRETGIPILNPDENSGAESAITLSGKIMYISQQMIKYISSLAGIPFEEEHE